MGPNLYTNRGAAVTANVKTGRRMVQSLTCYNTTASSRFIQLHDTATTPSAAAVPRLSFFVPASSQIVLGNDFMSKFGITFETGLAFALSTTIATYTAATAADHDTQIVYS